MGNIENLESNAMGHATSSSDNMAEHALMEIGGSEIKSENKGVHIQQHGTGFQLNTYSDSTHTPSISSQDDNLSPSSSKPAQVALSQESSPMTSDTSHQASPNIRTDCKPSVYGEMKSPLDNVQKSNTSPVTSEQSNHHSSSPPKTQPHSAYGSVTNQGHSNVSSGFAKTTSGQGTYGGVNAGVVSRDSMTNSSDTFYPSPGCDEDFPSGSGQFSVRTPINGGYNLMDNYSQAFPGDQQISRTSKDNLPTNYGHQQISGLKSNQLSSMEKQSSLQPEQKQYSFAAETTARVDTGYKSGNGNTQFHYSSNFNMNSNTYTHARGYFGYNNGLHGDNINLHGSMSAEEFDGQNHQLKQGPFTSGQLNVYPNGIYPDGYYGSPFNAGVNRTMSTSLLSQQSYLNTSPALHGSNMAENNGSFEQFNNMETTLNGDFGSLFGEVYTFPQHGFPT